MTLPSTPELLAREAATLARYVLPDAQVLLAVPRVRDRVARDYGAAVARHQLEPLGEVIGGGELQALSLWAWDGLLAPEPVRGVVRQRLLLMNAVLESQPELSAFFLPQTMGRAAAVWALAGASVGTVVSALLSLGLRVTHGGPRAS